MGIPEAVDTKDGNCVAKLVYGRYGLNVHQALEPDFAPKLYGFSDASAVLASIFVMEFLPAPTWQGPGWIPLSNLEVEVVPSLLDPIFDSLDSFIVELEAKKLVHGDLRPNNIMIKMANLHEVEMPVRVNVVDYEWAGAYETARYPADRNELIDYEGNAGDLIGREDDRKMIGKWKAHIILKAKELGYIV